MILDHCRHLDPLVHANLEAACAYDTVVVSGRVAADERALKQISDTEGLKTFVRRTFRSAGYGVDTEGWVWIPRPESVKVVDLIRRGPYREDERYERFESDDQAICVGYANDLEATNHLPPALWLARRISKAFHKLRPKCAAGDAGPDGKVLVRVESNKKGWKPLHVCCSISHTEASDWLRLRTLAELAVEQACEGLPTPEVSLNRGGMFTIYGPEGDNGLSGKKLVVDGYGPGVPIGGGAWSGKDLHKVDRVGGLLARQLAKGIIMKGVAQEALVELEYHPGDLEPSGIRVRLDGKAYQKDIDSLLPNLELRTEKVAKSFNHCKLGLTSLARWGHQQSGMPWEEL